MLKLNSIVVTLNMELFLPHFETIDDSIYERSGNRFYDVKDLRLFKNSIDRVDNIVMRIIGPDLGMSDASSGFNDAVSLSLNSYFEEELQNAMDYDYYKYVADYDNYF